MTTAPWQQHNYLGEFADDATATANVVARGWDVAGNPTIGMIYFNTTDTVIRYWNGTAWVNIGMVYNGALPAAGATYRGVIWIVEGGGGVRDKAYICLKSDGGVYSWVEVANGGV